MTVIEIYKECYWCGREMPEDKIRVRQTRPMEPVVRTGEYECKDADDCVDFSDPCLIK